MMTRSELLERAPEGVLPERGQRVLCAVSGGMDSMCLLHMLAGWCRERGGQVVAAHFNHRLRGEAADRDEDFVREICAGWNIPLTVGRGDVRSLAKQEGRSIEEAARVLRYDFLERKAETEACAAVYTAHHADDNAETLLLNLIRGTGLRGLAGMDWRRGKLRRPLLNVTRAELEDYAAAWNIPHVEDGTNADPEAASRNFLRLRVIPLLKELNPRAVEHMNQTAGQLRGLDSALEREAVCRTAGAEVREGYASLSANALEKAPEAARPRMLLRLFDMMGAGRKDITAAHLTALLEMAAKGEESRLSLPRGVTARYSRGRLILETRSQPLTEVRLPTGRPLRWGDYTLTLLDHRSGEGIALRDGEPEEPLTVGPCPAGGRLRLPGARGSRSVKRLCLDRGVSVEERDRLPAIRAGGKLAAVWRLGVDAAFGPERGKTCRFIKITKHIEEDGHDEKRNGE